MDVSLIIAILGFLLFISFCINVILYSAWNKIRRREKSRIERINQEGAPVFATVTRVIHQKGQRNYSIHAQWRSRETGKVYNFQESYTFLRGAINVRPKIQRGDVVQVNVIFDEFMYRIKRKK
jgi:hypothetical protein